LISIFLTGRSIESSGLVFKLSVNQNNRLLGVIVKNKFDFIGKIAIITGGSSGIGFAVAQLLAEYGGYVCILGRSQEKLDTALAQLEGIHSGKHLALSVDVSKVEEVNQAVQKVISWRGTPDLVVNSAGEVEPDYVQDLDLAVFREMIEINYLGTVYMTKAVLEGMIKRGSGHIVNISSLVGRINVIGYSAYGPAKAAMRSFSEALRMEMKPYGIQVSVVYPPDTETPQLAYDRLHRPKEITYIYDMFQLEILSPIKVAEAILKGIKNQKFSIYADSGTPLLFLLDRILGENSIALLDWLLKRAQKCIALDNSVELRGRIHGHLR
jgi:3-dehydrosphinganine reductase